MMHVTTPLVDEIGRYLSLASERMQLISSNMANVDTPGYRTQDIDFEQAFGRAADQVLEQREGIRTAPVEAQVHEVGGLLERPDGNNVSMDRESLELGKLQLQFRAAAALLKQEFTRISDAIHEDKS